MVGPAKAQGRSSAIDRELPALRTRNSRTYLTDAGDRVARVFSGAINYRDSAGGWVPIDNTLEPTGSGFANRANRYRVKLPSNLAGGPIRVEEDGDWVSFGLRGAEARGTAEGATARYPGAFPGVDVTYAASSESLKETLTLAGPDAASSYAFDLDASPGLTPKMTDSGGISLVDSKGEERMAIGAPFMIDSAEGAEPSDQVTYEVARAGDGWTLTLTADRQWLKDPKRQFPVQIDPSVYPVPVADCMLQSLDPTVSYCGTDNLKIGWSGDHDHNTIMRFDVQSVVPKAAQVLEAKLGLYLWAQSTTTSKPVRVHRLTRSFTSAANWSRYDGTNAWSAAGGDFDPTVESSTEVGATGSTNRYHYWGVRGLAEGWLKGTTPNDGLLLKDGGGQVVNALQFRASEHTDGTKRPYLDIRYEERTGVRGHYKFESQQLSDRISLDTNVANGNVMLRERDLAIPGGVGPDQTLSRTYNNLSSDNGAFGKGWTLDTGADVRLEFYWDNVVYFHGPSGYVAPFYKRSDGTYVDPAGIEATLTYTYPDGYTLTSHASQTKYRFNPSGKLTKQEDRNGAAINFAYGADGRLLTMTDSQSRNTTFAYNTQGLISQITDPAGRLYQYAYTGNLLTSYTNPDGKITRYEHGSDGPTKVTTPAGRITALTYFPATGADKRRVKTIKRVTNPTASPASWVGPTTQFAYTIGQNWSGNTVVTDAENHTTTHYYDTDGKVTRTVDGLGRESKTTYTSNFNVKERTLPGNTSTTPSTTLSYDTDNNLTGTNTPTSGGSGQAATTGPLTTGSTYGAKKASDPNQLVAGGTYLPTSSTNEQGRPTPTPTTTWATPRASRATARP